MSLGSMSGMNIFFAQTSARMVQLLREIAGSGLIMQPSERDLAHPELRPYLEKYMRGKEVDVEYKARCSAWPMSWRCPPLGCARNSTSIGMAATLTAIVSIYCGVTTNDGHRAHQDIGRKAVGTRVERSGVLIRGYLSPRGRRS